MQSVVTKNYLKVDLFNFFGAFITFLSLITEGQRHNGANGEYEAQSSRKSLKDDAEFRVLCHNTSSHLKFTLKFTKTLHASPKTVERDTT